ncbi:MAG: bifunctional folylpolyglutamate synthase/dihydrofolate synthase [bacterium]
MNISEIENYLRGLANREIKPLRILDGEIDELNQQFKSLKLTLPYTVKILGTNGKGSTAAMLSTALTACGLKVVCFSSPHLVNWRERIQLNNQNISEDQVQYVFSQLYPQLLNYQTKTYFTVIFLMSLLYTQLTQADVLIAEAGLGGSYDATRILPANLTLVTSLGLDHQNLLGNTVVDIALDKLGGLNEGTVAITNPQPSLENLFKIRARLKSVSQLIFTDPDKIRNFKQCDCGHLYQYVDDNTKTYQLPVWGVYQQHNLQLVVEALEKISEVMNIDVPRGLKGLEKLQLPARFQIVSKHPLKIVDGSHNQPAVRSVVETFKNYYPHRKVTLYFAAMKDKNIMSMLETLRPITTRYIFTKFQNKRCFNPHDFRGLLDSENCKILPLSQAVNQFFETSEDCLAVGSFHWAGELLKKLTK